MRRANPEWYNLAQDTVTEQPSENALRPGLPRIGEVIAGKYRIDSLLGRGAMGAVFRAEHRITGRRVALKWMITEGESMRRRFLREARAMAIIEHPNVVSVLDVGEHEGSVFLVMEYLEGRSLRAHVDGKALAPAEAIRLLMPALEGVAAAHQAGLVHRDLKPENLFVCLDHDGTPFDTRVLDLGVARWQRARNHPDGDLTQSGVVIGTPRYMAPEQLRGSRDIDQRVDVFALGLILYELLTGRLPYDAESYESLVIDIATGTPPSPRVFRPEIPEALASVVLRALARNPDDRHPNVASLAADLEPFGDGVRFRPPRAVHVRRSEPPADAEEASPWDPTAHVAPAPVPSGRPTIDQRKRRDEVTPVSSPDAVSADRSASAGTIPGLARHRARSAAIALVVFGLGLGAVLAWRGAASESPASPPHEPAPARSEVAEAPPVARESAPTAAPTVDPGTPTTPGDEPAAAAPDAAPSAIRATRRSATPLEPSPATAPLQSPEARGRSGVLRSDDF